MTDYNKIVENYQNRMDHTEHFVHVLKKLEEVLEKGLTGPIIEIGTNQGGSSLCIMELLYTLNKSNYLVGLDPYGGIPYHNGAFVMEKDTYTNTLYTEAMISLYEKSKKTNIHYTHFKLPSLNFAICYNGIWLYRDGKEEPLSNNLAFVYLDGSHDPGVVKEEIKFFSQKIEFGGAVIVDDYEDNRFTGFWDEFFKNNPQFCRDKTPIPNKTVIEYK